MVQKLQKLSGW